MKRKKKTHTWRKYLQKTHLIKDYYPKYMKNSKFSNNNLIKTWAIKKELIWVTSQVDEFRKWWCMRWMNLKSVLQSEVRQKDESKYGVLIHMLGFPGGASGKEPACQWSKHKRLSPWTGKIPWRRAPQPTLYSFLENPMDREAWWVTIHRVTKSRTWLQRLSRHAACKAYIWNLEKWDWWTNWQGRDREQACGHSRLGWPIETDAFKYIHYRMQKR